MNYIGKGGKTLNDRELAAEVRTLTLKECRKYLKKGEGQMYEAILLKLAGSVLPRLQEVTGEGGQPLILEISNTIAKKNAITPDTRHNSG